MSEAETQGPLPRNEELANALIRARGLDYGTRYDNPLQLKGSGFYGALPRSDNPSMLSTEISGSQNGLSFPLIYQGMSPVALRGLLAGQPPSPELYDQAEQAARGRMSFGLPAFALEGEQSNPAQMGMAPPVYGIQPRPLWAK